MCLHSGLECRFYDLLPEKDWEVDLGQVAKLRDERTVAILVCNPGNPCGQVYSRQHLVEILTTAAALRLPIIADEVYEGIAFQEASPFIPLRAAAMQLALQHPQQPQQSHADHAANSTAAAGSNGVVGNGVHVGKGNRPVVSGEATHEAVQKKASITPGAAAAAAAGAAAAGSVPILTVSSLSKRFLVPGWRVGWIAVHDPRHILKGARVIESLERILQYAPQPCSLIQSVNGWNPCTGDGLVFLPFIHLSFVLLRSPVSSFASLHLLPFSIVASSPFVAGVAVATAALAARYGIEAWQAFKARPAVPRIRRFYEGGFQPTMTRREAALILGIRESAAQEKVREAHRRVMTANHPDAGGSDLLASKINEAKDVLMGQSKGSGSAF
ncbi:unnamed protein product [Closterium sp. NIES-53]